MSKFVIPILAILGGALYIRHCFKDANKEGDVVREMVIEDPSGDDPWYIPDWGPDGEP